MLTTAELIVLADRSMPGFERTNVGEWTLRSALGSTGRANSALPIGDPGLEVGQAIGAVESWYAERGYGAIFQVFESADDLSDELMSRGYVASELSEVYLTPIEAVRIGHADGIVVHEEIPPAFHILVDDPDRVSEITAAPLEALVAVVEGSDASAIGCGMAVIDGDAAGIFAMRTAADAWGQGVGGSVFAALVAAARERKVTELWLQVEQSNTRAREWYERVGFQRVDGYRYWRPSIPAHA
jgi:ribosomal protein S18 acetylase RimI-like enzyme